jgi:hypothetical protein
MAEPCSATLVRTRFCDGFNTPLVETVAGIFALYAAKLLFSGRISKRDGRM